MNIALVCSAYLPHIGGVEMVVNNLAKEFDKKGHNVIVIASKAPPVLPSYELIDDIPVYRVGYTYPTFHPGDLIRSIANVVPIIRDMSKILKEHDTSIMNAHFVAQNAFYANLTKFLIRSPVPVISTLHGSDVYLYPRYGLSGNLLFKVNMRWSDHITTHSEALLREAERYSRIREKTTVIPNGVNLEEFDLKDVTDRKRPYILAIGRFVPVKGFDVLIKAFSLIEKEYPRLGIVLIGYGPEKEKYASLIRRLELKSRIEIIERPKREEVIKLLNGCEFFVLSSRREGLPIVVLEAMAAGKAIVATKVGALAEIIEDKRNGLLVQRENPRALADGMETLLENEKCRRHMEKENRRRSKRFAWEKKADEYLKVYERTIRERQHREGL